MHVLDFGGGGLAVLAGLPHVGTVVGPAAPGRRAPGRRRGGGRAGPAGAAVPERRVSDRSRSSGPAGRRVSFPTSPPRTSCSWSTATSCCAASSTTWRPGCCRSPRRGSPTACTWWCRRTGGASCGLRSRTSSAAAWSCGWASRASPRWTAAAPLRVPARPGHGLAADGARWCWPPRGCPNPRTSGGDRGTGDLVAAVADGLDRPVVRPGRRAAGPRAPGRHPRGRRGRVPVPAARRHSDRRRRGGPRPGRGRPDGRSAPGLLRGRRERQDHPAAGARARARRAGARRTGCASWSSTTAAGCSARCPASHLLVYASTADAAEQAARDIAASLRGRLPGPDRRAA